MNILPIYDRVRASALRAAEEDLQYQITKGLFDDSETSYQSLVIEVGSIDDRALDAWSLYWDGHSERRYGWDWRVETSSWQTTLRRVDAAIWANEELCGLMIGMATKGRSNLRVDLLEGSPDKDHPLKGRIAYCVTEIAEAFGFAYGCDKVTLHRPLDDAIPLYEALGFVTELTPQKVRHCVRRIV